MIDALEVLRSTVAHPWESLGRFVALHAEVDLGDPADETSPACQLLHTAVVFRIHAKAASNGALTWSDDADLQAANLPALRDLLLRDIDTFIVWCRDTNAQPDAPVPGRSEADLAEMVGVMIRHIVWHTACAHQLLKDVKMRTDDVHQP